MNYRIFKKMHDLEKRRTRELVLECKTSSGELYVIPSLEHLYELLNDCLGQFNGDLYVESAVR